ncbi:MAG: c-type cytochrome biogenesis protein CcsB [Deltaproteobacteria bacterium]|nr:c-type cytochrome biogenesis protein CcsB [Deltaproteobacteria bacterium]
MSDTAILSGVTFVYLLSFLLYLLRMVRGKEFWGSAASRVARIGFLLHTAALLLRWKSSYDLGIGHAPLANFYESLIFFAWAVLLLYLIIEWRTRSRSLGAFVIPVAFLLLAFASISPGVSDRIQPLIPALQSNWLTIHVLTCFLGYASFAVAFAVGIMYLLKGRARAGGTEEGTFLRLIPPSDALEELLYQGVVLGFVLLSLGIMTGSVWAHYAWGSYWSWDPKETWSLITWIVYAVMLHARSVRGWRGKRMAVMSLVGFASVLFTYLGVNYLDSLHSYF